MRFQHGISIFILILISLPAIAQSRRNQEATLSVTVVDPSGAAIQKADVKITGVKKSSGTNSRGQVTFKGLMPGEVQIEVTATGFEAGSAGPLTLNPGENSIEVRLEIAAVQEEIVVGQDKREASTDPRGNAFTNILTAEQIAQLPDDPDEFEDAIRQMAGPGATFRVNGFRGGKLPP